MMKYIVLDNGQRIEADDGATYYIGKDKTLYVYVLEFYGYGYEPIGKVKEIIEEEEE